MGNFKRVAADVGMGLLDNSVGGAYGIITGRSMTKDLGYKTQSNFGRNVLDPGLQAGRNISSAIAPTVANAILPGSGTALQAVQGVVTPLVDNALDNNQPIMAAYGGDITQPSQEMGALTEYNGPSHEMGGVQPPGGNFETEGPENNHNGMIQTDRLLAPPELKEKLGLNTSKYANASFAELGRAVKSKLSKVDRETDTFTKEALENKLKLIDDVQESVKQSMAQEAFQQQQQQFAMGGNLNNKPKFILGGESDTPFMDSRYSGSPLNLSGFANPEQERDMESMKMGQSLDLLKNQSYDYNRAPSVTNSDPNWRAPISTGNQGNQGERKLATNNAVIQYNLDNANIPDSTQTDLSTPFSNYARYAPVVGSLAQIGMTLGDKPTAKDPSMFNTDSDIKANLVDRTELERNINNTYGGLNIDLANRSSGSSGSFLQNRRASAMEQAGQLANANLNSSALDTQELARVQNMRYNQDVQNSNKEYAVTDMNDRDAQAYSNELRDSVGALFQNTGQVATDVDRDKKLEGMGLYYDNYGRYVDKFGNYVGFNPTKTKPKTN